MTLLAFLVLAGTMLGLLHLLYRRFWDRALSMTLSFSSAQAFEGESLVLREDVTNAKPLPLPFLTAKYRLSRHLVFENEPEGRVSDHYYRSDVFAVNLFQHIVRRQSFVCEKRGYYQVGGMELVNSGLFHGQTLVRELAGDATLTVFPRLLPFDGLEVLYRQMLGEAEVRRFTSPDPFAFRGIRGYTPGDDFRHLNFKASAKSGELMVNLYSPTATREVILLLNLEPYAAYSRDLVLEGSIRIAASAAAYFIGLGLTVGLATNGPDSVTGGETGLSAGGGQAHLYSLLECLARVDLTRPIKPFAEALAASATAGRVAQPYYLLVSANCGDDVAAAYRALGAKGTAARWIVPGLPGRELPLPPDAGITRWEL